MSVSFGCGQAKLTAAAENGIPPNMRLLCALHASILTVISAMKHFLLTFSLFTLMGCAAFPAAESTPFVAGWSFVKGDVSLADTNAAWEPVTLPHTWNAADALDGGGTDTQSRDGYYRGPGWYRKSLFVERSRKGQRLFLRFEAAGSVADLYVNGVHVGQHRGAFGSFCFELTGQLKYGATNQIALRADNSWRSDVPPLSGDFPVFGGIYRPVSLLVKAAACITPLDYASSGVYIAQKAVSKEQATVAVRTKIDNAGTNAPLEVQCVIKDAAGTVLASDTKAVTVVTTGAVTQELTLADPHLWNGRKDPYLHTVEVSLKQNGTVIDSSTQPLGLRFFRVDPEKGFLLNGESYPLYGVNRHQDRVGKGWAVSAADHEEDVRLILEMGARTVRLAHYPHAAHFYELCDQAGLLVWAEVPNVDCVSAGPEYAANAREQLIELVRQQYNHPAIFCWSLFNEIFHRDSADAIPLLKELHTLAKQEDPGRFTAGASNKRREDLCNITDLLAFNAYPGWYNGGPDGMEPVLKTYNALGRRRGIAVSEYGAGASIIQHEQNPPKPVPVSRWHPEEWQAIVHEENYATIKNTPYCWGSFAWNMFDFASPWRNEGDAPGINDKGLVTYDRKTRKDSFYLYKANWSGEPVLYLTSRRHTDRDEAVTPIKVYSNAAEVTLRVNGMKIGTKAVNDLKIALWDEVQLRPGENRIEAAAVFDGRNVTDSCVWKLR